MYSRSLAATCIALSVATTAGAQQAATPPPPAAPVVAGWNDGFFLQSGDGHYRLQLGLLVQTDGRFSLDDPKPIINTFLIRKVRPTLSGLVARYIAFRVMPDFGNGAAVIADAYVDVRFSSKFQLRAGKDKTPVGYEWLECDACLLFPERALASSLVPNRDVGIQMLGALPAARVSYAGGIFNGVPDGTSSTTDLDSNNNKDFAGRIFVQPFTSPKAPIGALTGLGFHVGGSTGRQIGALPSFRTSVGQTYFSYASGAAASGVRHRISPAVSYFYKSFGAFGEYMRSSQSITKAAVQTDVTNQAWAISASLLLTGDRASYGLVRPKHDFDPDGEHYGAVQVVARYTRLTVDQAAFTAGLAAANASRQATSFTVGMNWMPSAFVKIYGTFERTAFDNKTIRPVEHVILIRTQLAF